MSIRSKISLMRSLTSKKNRSGISSRLKFVFLCLGILICGVVLVYATILNTHNRDKRSQAELTGSISPSPTPVHPSAKTGMNSSSEQVRKQADETSGKDVLRAAARRLPRGATTSPVASAGKSSEFQSKLVAVIPESGKSKSVFETPGQTTAQKTAERSLATPSNDATPRWIPPAKRQETPGTAAEPNKPKAIDHPASDPTAPGLPNPGLAKDNAPASSSVSINNEKQRSEEVDKRKLSEALKNAREDAIKKKDSGFRVAPGLKTATTGKTEGPVAANPNAAQEPSTPVQAVISKPPLVYPAEFSGDVRLLPQGITDAERNLLRPALELEGPEIKEKKPLPGAEQSVQPPASPEVPLAPMPAPLQSFPGLNFASNGGGWPPDTVGDVGPNHYIQAVNTSLGIFNKTGTQLATFTFNSLWAGAGTMTPCDNSHNGDPTVIYSRQNNRFIVADFAWTNTMDGPYYECIAVSKTSDPVSGGWWLFAYRADDAAHPWLPDYPKMGIWRDGLYMGANMFDCPNSACSGAPYQQARAYAFNLTDLVTGAPLRSVVADTNNPDIFSMFPSNYRGTPPPAGRENLFVSESLSVFGFEVWKFHVDYSGSGSTFTGPTLVSQSSYGFPVPPTVPSPGNSLDSLSERIMMQVQYRNVAGVESLWVNHTTGTASAVSPVGIQWAQINVTGGTIASPPVQQQIYNNAVDGLSRWMGALAVDNQGNMALGFSASGAALNPDIRYAGRLSTDPLGSLPQTEVSMIPAAVVRGTQLGNCPPLSGGTCVRWGDYSSMSIDPSDECTFWYTQEYYETTGISWRTRIGSFKFPTCIPAPTQFTGTDTIGLYGPANASFFLRNSNSFGVTDATFTYGPAGAGFIPLVGDWNGDGIDTTALYNPTMGAFFLRNSNSGGVADISFPYGPAGAGFIPLAGDWDGDGITTIGLYNPAAGTFFLRNSNSAGVADIAFAFGPAGAGFIPIVGDWDGNGTDTVGLYNPAAGAFFLKNSNTTGVADIVFSYGPAGAGFIPIVGDWDGNGTDTIGLYNPATGGWFLRNSNSGGIADISFAYGPGALGLKPLVGNWDGQ
ncbi:MAG TPA: hypothetical protein VKN18_07195 [Blastocatellia bacterium]|nr:hypothetical protein [Blastocatellia bacterium]